VVIDVQNEYFPDGGLPIEFPPIADTLPRIAQAMDAATAAGVPVVVVQNTAPAGFPVFDRGTPGWQLHPEVAARPADHHIDKAWPSVFTGTDFADWLAARHIDTLTVVGYMTHNCDASTIFEATHRGLQVEFLADASGALPYANSAGAVTAEEIHRVFSVVFHTRFAAVANTQVWVGAVAAGAALPQDNVLMSNRRARGLL
jgi:nicotinamidase-related amidase